MSGSLIFASILVISFVLLMVLLWTAAGVEYQSIFGVTEKRDGIGCRVDSDPATYGLSATLFQSVRQMRHALLCSGNDEVKVQTALLRKTRAKREEYVGQLERCFIANLGCHPIVAIVRANKVFIGCEGEFIRLAEADQMEEARVELLSRAYPALWSYIEAIDALIQFQESEV